MKADKWETLIRPALDPDETVEVAVLGQLGEVSAKRRVATAAVVSAATLGTFTAYARAKRAAVVLTDRRLVLFETGINGTKPTGRVLGSLPRGSFHLAPASSLLTRKFDLVGEDGTSLRLTFAVAQKADADDLARRVAGGTPPAD